MHWNHLEGLINHRLLSPAPFSSGFSYVGWDPNICIPRIYGGCSTGNCTLRTIGLRKSNESFLSQAFCDIVLNVRAWLVFWEMKGRFVYSTQRADSFQNPQTLGPAPQVTLGSASLFPLDASLWQKTSSSHRLEDSRNMPPGSTTKKIKLKWEEFVILSKVRFLSLNFLPCTLVFLRSLTILKYLCPYWDTLTQTQKCVVPTTQLQ